MRIAIIHHPGPATSPHLHAIAWGLALHAPYELPGLTCPAFPGSLVQACEWRSCFEKDPSVHHP
ncbi:MAG: hypothetical protein MUF86_15895, partial [Akkermansiaceae bacterium]|nr:hypothetical protein [Akkermansiaceae bacterium]